MKDKTYDDAKQTYLNHAQDKSVLKKLSPSHIIGLKKVELEERKLQIESDALRAAVLGKLMGGPKVIEGIVNESNSLPESGEGTGEE